MHGLIKFSGKVVEKPEIFADLDVPSVLIFAVLKDKKVSRILSFCQVFKFDSCRETFFCKDRFFYKKADDYGFVGNKLNQQGAAFITECVAGLCEKVMRFFLHLSK